MKASREKKVLYRECKEREKKVERIETFIDIQKRERKRRRVQCKQCKILCREIKRKDI